VVLAQAKLGDFSGIKTLDTTLSTLVSGANSTAGFATRTDYERNFYQTYNSIAELEGLTGNQLSIEQQTLDVMKAQLVVLQQIAATPPALNIPAPATAGGEEWGGTVSAEQYADWNPDLVAFYNNWVAAQKAGDLASYASWGGAPHLYTGQSLTDFFNLHAQDLGDYRTGDLPRSFDEGGISSGAESGYEANLHGTELVISPRKGYPASVKGGDNVILIEEIRALRAEMKSGNSVNKKNTDKMARLLDKIDADGLAVRV